MVVTAASLDPGVAEAIAADPHACLLPKPFRPDEVVRAVADLLGGGGIRAPAGPGRLP